MAKTISNEKLIEKIQNTHVVTEREILLIKSRLNHGRMGIDSLNFLGKENVYVTDEQSQKGLDFLRKKLLTKRNCRRKNCNWGEYELQDIGWQGDDVCMKNIKVHHLFTLIGFMNIYPWIPYYVPIYAIGDTFYYMKNGVPTIY